MVNVKDLNSSADKLERRGQQAQGDFESGVENTTDSEQQEATLNSTQAWEQGIQDALNNGSFESGVRNTSKSWQEQTLENGARRFAEGVGNAGDTWQDSFEEFANELESLSLQPRGARGSTANFERSRAVGEALHNARSE